MHRKPLLELISNYQLRYPDEHAVTSRLREFMDRNSNCFSRELKIGHVTGSAWILDTSRKHVLLTHHRKLNIWVQLGGHADGDSDIFNVARREALEESGLALIKPLDHQLFDIDIHKIPSKGDEQEHYHYDCRFIFQAGESDEYVVSDESHDLKWIPLESVTMLNAEESMGRMVKKTPMSV